MLGNLLSAIMPTRDALQDAMAREARSQGIRAELERAAETGVPVQVRQPLPVAEADEGPSYLAKEYRREWLRRLIPEELHKYVRFEEPIRRIDADLVAEREACENNARVIKWHIYGQIVRELLTGQPSDDMDYLRAALEAEQRHAAAISTFERAAQVHRQVRLS